MTSPPSPLRFAVLVPVKRVSAAKSRLGSLGDDARRALVAAFAADTVTAALGSELVATVVVVTDDHELATGLRVLGAQAIPDGVAEDLNGSLVQASAEVARRWPTLGVAALCADLPALRSDELTTALAAASTRASAFVADTAGSGTTMLAAVRREEFRPAFGPGSCHRHLEQGAWQVHGIHVPTLRQDVDTPADLAAVLQLGVGSRTALAATGLRL